MVSPDERAPASNLVGKGTTSKQVGGKRKVQDTEFPTPDVSHSSDAERPEGIQASPFAPYYREKFAGKLVI